jgi:hydroxymethylpyrimidine/phosphomethylpyrimidine kinase
MVWPINRKSSWKQAEKFIHRTVFSYQVNPKNQAHQGSLALSIAGFDPSGGAGLLADVKTFEANGVYGMGVVSALTWQNDVEFHNVEWITAEKIIAQIQVLLRRFNIRHIKIGLIENAEVLYKLLKFLKGAIDSPVIVYDPILKASAGYVFHDADPDQFIDIMRGVSCITPNIPEATYLFGEEDLHDRLMELRRAFNIYLKGGHTGGNTSLDVLYTKEDIYTFSKPRLPNGEKHGSGCVLSSALLARMALGYDLPEAAEKANQYTYQYLGSSDTLLGTHKPLPHETDK